MTVPHLLLVALSALPVQSPRRDGAIVGTVVNASDQEPVGGAKVVLRVGLRGEHLPLAETIASPQGRFVFENLFVGRHYEYLPGANRDGIHYPGPHVRLTAGRPQAVVKLEVCDSVAEPNPLVMPTYEVLVRPEPGAVHVTESIVVDNPSTTCYVGKPPSQGAEPATLELAIPPDFLSVTFHKEFLGRRFSVRDGKVVTGIPWTPGRREVKITYVLSCEQSHHLWERPLDLPCSSVRLRVISDKPEEVSCNLGKSTAGADGEVVFESGGQLLPAGHVLRLELGRLPVPWMTYARWAALAVLGALVAGGSFALIRRRRCANRRQARAASTSRPESPQDQASQGGRRPNGRGRKRKRSFRRAA